MNLPNTSQENPVGQNKRSIRAWCMYDWAISGFQTTIIGALLPIFFEKTACVHFPKEQFSSTNLWSIISAISMIGVAIIALILGPLSDYCGVKKRLLALFTWIGIIFTSTFTFTGPGDWIWLSVLFILANIAAAGSEVFYDALLPHIASSDQMAKISTRAYALGYLGGGLLLAINLLMIYLLPEWGMQASFLSVAVWWGIFSIPLFRHVHEPRGTVSGWPGYNKAIRISIKRLQSTFQDIRKNRNTFLFLLAFWCYSDGIGTIIRMATIYGKSKQISDLHLIGALLLVQFIGIPCTVLFGKLSRVLSTKCSILIGLMVYIGISVGGFFMHKAIHFWILAACVGLVQGGTQALSRSLYARMIPKQKSAEFFSFYNISGKFAGIMGPALFFLFSQLFKDPRYGILSLIFFFIVGGALLIKVPEPENSAVT